MPSTTPSPKLRQFERAAEVAFADYDARPIHEWARENVELHPPLSITGPFDVKRSPHFVPIFDALQDDHCREVNVLKPVRGGGTLIADVWVPWTVKNDPGPFMFVLQTDQIAAEHAEAILMPTLIGCEAVRELLPVDRHKKRNQEILFANGHPFYICGPSIGNLQTKGIRYGAFDEVWCWPKGRMGDAEGRVGDYVRNQTSKILRISQAGPHEDRTIDECDWHRAYHLGEINEWEVACTKCGHHMRPGINQLRDDGTRWGLKVSEHKRENGDWDLLRCVSTVRFECQKCGHEMLDGEQTKLAWISSGRYALTTEPNPKRRSYHWNAVIDYPWEELAWLWLDADNYARRKQYKLKIQFYQKRLAEFMDEERLRRSEFNIARVVYDVQSDWPEEKARCMAVDVQRREGVFWYMVRAWGEGKTRRLAFGKAYSFQELEEIRTRFGVPRNRLLIDSGDQSKAVYGACCRYGWIALKGSHRPTFVNLVNGRYLHSSYKKAKEGGDPEAVVANAITSKAVLILFSKPQLNDTVQNLIDSGAWVDPQLPDGDETEKEYNAQMAGRFKKYDRDNNGRLVTTWIESENDHARDLANFQALFAILLRLMPDPVAERRAPTREKAEPEAAPEVS